ncbi:MAG: hypothetical protein M9930_06795 [Anaerolineae bacterium]|nr:hypothetical protein [Anaerolineae bacterium]
MSESARMWMEIVFNLTYLIAIWAIVIAMIVQRHRVPPQQWSLARLFILAFGLLALGDTGHVGFRVWAYAAGGLDAVFRIGATAIGLVGLGALATAFTVTLFYMLMVVIWHTRFQKPYGWFGYFLLALGVVRLILMLFPQNEWNSVVPPQPWSLIRNAPLLIMGLSVAYLILRDAYRAGDRPFVWIGWMIVLSYVFYLPVILFVQQVPMVGMLMIPKTLAYVAIAIIAYRTLYHAPDYHLQPGD